MFRTIVVGLDGSEGSRHALPMAVELAKRDNARLVFAHVIEEIAGKGGRNPVFADEEEVRAELGRQAGELSAQGVETSIDVREVVLGGPAHALADIARDEDADVIVVGTRGHAPVAGLLLGSVTQRLLHIAHRPVLAVPPPKRGD